MNKAFRVISALERGIWAIEPLWALQHLSIAEKLLAGEPVVSFADDEEEKDAQTVATLYIEDGGFWRTASEEEAEKYDGMVQVVSISGPLFKNGTWCNYGTTDYTNSVWGGYQNPNVSAILLDIDSPGGEVSGVPSLYDAVRHDAKPVVGFCNDGLMCSGGYYLTAGADHIYASQRTDLIGSIGVYTRLRDLREYYKSQGIKFIEVYAEQSLEKNLEIRKAFQGDTKPLVAELSSLAEEFISAVKYSRGDKLTKGERDPFKGGAFFATEAQALGLIDGIVPLGDALSVAADMGQTKRKKSVNFSSNYMFGSKYKSLTALRGKAAAAVTDADLDTVNAELKAEGVEGVVVVNASWIADAEKLQSDYEAAQQQLADAGKDTEKTKALENQVAQLTKERDDAQAEVQRLGRQPGEKPLPKGSQKHAEGEDGSKNVEKTLSELSHYKALEELGI